MRINGEYDNGGLSDEEARIMNERDEPVQSNLNEKERLGILENAVQDLIISTMEGGTM